MVGNPLIQKALFSGLLIRIKVFRICVPTHAVYAGRALRTAISLGDNPPGIVDVNTLTGAEEWSKNVIRGYSSAKTEFMLKEKGLVDLKMSLLDPGFAISEIIIY